MSGEYFYLLIDPMLILFYRITGAAFLDFIMGTFILGLFAVIIGEFSISLAFLATRSSIEENVDNVARFQNISVDAIETGDKKTYEAANKLANDAFGKSFFQQIALAAGLLWPIPFALGWMQLRFSQVEFNLAFTEHTVGYAFVFFPMYAAAYLVFKRVKYKIPYFRRIKEILDQSEKRHENMRSFADLFPKKGGHMINGEISNG